MTDEAPKEREPLYFRLTSGAPAMVWPSPDGSEAIFQLGRQRPRVLHRYTQVDENSLNVVLIDLLSQTKCLVTPLEWHTALGTGEWSDREDAWV